MQILHGVKIINGAMQQHTIYRYIYKPRNFHRISELLRQSNFEEKPIGIKNLKIKQAHFQKDDGVPVYLKNGLPDKILFNFTAGGVVIGVIMSIKFLLSLKYT